MAYSAFGINYDTSAKISAYGGDAETPAQPIWAEDTHQLWIVHGTAGKYRVAMASELASYLTTATASSTYLSKTDAAQTYLTQANASQAYLTQAAAGQTYLSKDDAASTYLGINAKATSAAKADSATTANSANTAADAVKKACNRSALAGFETIASGASAITINATSADDQVLTGAVAITVANGSAGQTWQKNVGITNAGASVAPGNLWKWAGGKAPEMKANSLLVCKWLGTFGILSLVVTE